ncbi:hypothetical protein Tco_0396942, partial [Tanacetum coccineum]
MGLTILEKFAMKRRYLKGQPKLGLWYPRDSPFDLEAFSDSDYAGASLDKKSTTGGCQFLGKRLISWQCKKQTIVANSTTEAEYVAAANCCGNTVYKDWENEEGLPLQLLLRSRAGQLNLLLPVLVYAARHSLNAIRHKLMLPGITSYCWFAETHNLVAFLEKPKESNGFEGIIDFLNASSIKYALTVNPTVYESCIKQFWATAKAKTINEECQIQVLVDKKKVIITEKSIRSDLMLEDDEGTEYLPNDVIFEQLTLMGAKTTSWNEFSSTIASAIISPEDMNEDSVAPIDSHSTPIITQPSSFKPQKKNSKRKQRKDSGSTEPITDEATNEEPISTPSYDTPQSGEDRLQLTKLMNLYTKLQKQVLDLEEAKTAQAKEIASLKKRVKQLEKRKKSGTSGLKRLRKGRKIVDLDEEVTLIDETQERYDKEMLFDVQDDLHGEEVVAEKEVSAADPVTTTEIKEAKPKDATTSATTITTAVASTRPKAKGIIFHDQEEQTSAFTLIVSSSQLTQAKDKGKGKMVEPEKPLKKKDQIALDEELALRLHAEEQAELE